MWANIARMLSVLFVSQITESVVQGLAWSALHQYILKCSGCQTWGQDPLEGSQDEAEGVRRTRRKKTYSSSIFFLILNH